MELMRGLGNNKSGWDQISKSHFCSLNLTDHTKPRSVGRAGKSTIDHKVQRRSIRLLFSRFRQLLVNPHLLFVVI
ncbi:hypothetical protein OPV22_032449 [Ensete ventricosum]|uniref:Uncharacterized protein n=1 Tax=Ensete ventricosum TaxID=4639 RepID=A0AAV8PRG9_ENSVE|nr:hypothetical protein OPV22_032449 [Ensete ventricosum]